MAGLLDGLFNTQQYGGLLSDVQRWQRSPEQAQQAFEQPTSSYQYGGQMVPVYGQAPQQPEVSAQARMPQQPMQQPQMPQQPEVSAQARMPQQPMQQPQMPPPAAQAPGDTSIGDRFRAGLGGFTTNAHTGPMGSLLGAISGFATGDYDSGTNATVKALVARGLDPTMAKAAVKNPQIMAAVIPNLFGSRKGEVVNNRLVDPTTGRVIADFSDSAKPIPLSQDQRLVNPVTGQQLVGPAQVANLDAVSGIRKEISGLPEVKRYGEAAPIFRSMVESQNKDTAAADLDFVYGVAKIFDPESVVREGEMKLVGQAQSLPEEIKGYIKRVAMGEGKLTPEARYRILEVANTRMGELRGAYDTRVSPFGGIADRAKINREDIMPAMVDLPKISPPPAKETELPRPASVAEAMKLPKGTPFIDGNGVRRIR